MLRLIERSRSGPWPHPDADVRWGPGAAVLVLVSTQILAFFWFLAVASLLWGTEFPTAEESPIWSLPLLNIGLWIGYLFGPMVVNRVTASGPMVDFDLRVGLGNGILAVIVGVGSQLVVLPALYWVLLRFVSGDPGARAEQLADQVDGRLDVALLVVSTVVAAPLIEEWFFRGMLLSALIRRIGFAGGAVATSLVFAVVHQDPILFPGLFVLAMALAWLTVRTGRIGVAVVAHVAFNTTTIVQLLLLS